MFKNLRKKKKGFTLIELIIVIAIIAILAAVAIPKFGDITKNAKEKSDFANAKVIADAVTILITEGDIGLNAGDITVIKSAAANSDAKDIENYLQNVPSPQSEGTSFVVNVTDGKITVKSNAATNATTFFPQP